MKKTALTRRKAALRWLRDKKGRLVGLKLQK
jgi:hypothetical protein